ncbi:MAG: nucleotidyltransferase substrate binding protein [Bacteroidales bacterium]|nr:nucleotidyltransferase substrate binding protein [Bacteroidales bacterium]
MANKDIRWVQRFGNLKKAFQKLEEAVVSDLLSELEKEGLIQRFEYTYELAWKTLQDLLEAKGYHDIKGPLPVLQQAFQDGIITKGDDWMRLKKSRESTSHTYNKEVAEEIVQSIIDTYYQLFKELIARLEQENEAGGQARLF